MKENNPPKKLKLLKKTIAHLTYEQMDLAHACGTDTRIQCIDNNFMESIDCLTTYCDTDFCIY